MRIVMVSMAFGLSLLAAQAQALTEWRWHKTPDGLHPNGEEQQYLWLTNRARQDPYAEGAWLAHSGENDVRRGRDYYRVSLSELKRQFARLAPRPPAAHDVRLYRAAEAHSRAQARYDIQSHNNQVQRVGDAGFQWRQFRGNVYSYADNPVMGHAGFNIDWGHGAFGMQTPAGHRFGILSVDGSYTNVGISNIHESNPATRVGPQIVTQNFAQADTTYPDHYNRFLVGTVWTDRNRNQRYDVGEGHGGVTVTPGSGEFYAVTAAGGGYAIPVTRAGAFAVTFSGGSIVTTLRTAHIGRSSVLLDLQTRLPGVDQNTNSSDDVIELELGKSYGEGYGNGFGRHRYRNTIISTFQNPERDVMLFVRAFDVALHREVDVFLNGTRIGSLTKGASNRINAGDRFYLRHSRLQERNVLEFRQRYDNERWGLSRIALVADATVAQSESTASSSITTRANHRSSGGLRGATHATRFEGQGKDLLLRAWGYDIDSANEVQVVLNGAHLGWMKAGRNNSLQRSSNFSIPGSVQKPGENVIQFRSNDDSWGVENIRFADITGPVTKIAIGQVNNRRFGWNYGSSEHRSVVRAEFEGDGRDMVVATAYTVTPPARIGVFLNGVRVGLLEQNARTKDAPIGQIVLPKGLQRDGTNSLEYRYQGDIGKRWGVTRFNLFDAQGLDLELRVGETHVGKIGWNFGSGQNSAVVRARFVSSDQDIELAVDGFDIGAREVSVWLNARLLGFMPSTQAGQSESARFVLPRSRLLSGANEIEFHNARPRSTWGLSNLHLSDVTGHSIGLEPGVMDYRSFGYRFGGSAHRSVLRAQFMGSQDAVAA